MDKRRSQVVSDVPVLSVPDPKEQRGSPGPGSPALPMRRQLQTDWLYSWTRWGAAGPTHPGHAHTVGGGLSMPQSQHTTPALGLSGLREGAWHELAPGLG